MPDTALYTIHKSIAGFTLCAGLQMGVDEAAHQHPMHPHHPHQPHQPQVQEQTVATVIQPQVEHHSIASS